MIIPLWSSSTWWHLVAPDAMHLSNFFVDWVWIPRDDPSIFVAGAAPSGRAVSSPNRQLMTVRLDFSSSIAHFRLSKRDRCIHSDCRS